MTEEMTSRQAADYWYRETQLVRNELNDAYNAHKLAREWCYFWFVMTLISFGGFIWEAKGKF